MTADVVFKPRELHHELAQSETGIAEFILPAVFAGHLDRMVWLRAPWCDQIRDGRHQFVVGELPPDHGEDRGPLRVSSFVPYFSDEGFSAEADGLVNAKPLALWVTEQAGCDCDELAAFLARAGEKLAASSQWWLDICLDYFSVNNPFLDDLNTKLGVERAQVVKEVFAGSRVAWRTIEAARTQSSDEAFIRETLGRQRELHLAFNAAVGALFAGLEADPTADASTCQLRHQAVGSLADCLCAEATCADDEAFALAGAFASILESATAKERELIQECGPFLDLPHHRSDRTEMEGLLCRFEALVEQLQARGLGRPSLVTVAKSSSDEFDYTPSQDVKWLLENVLQILERRFGALEVEEDEVDDEADEPSAAE